MRPLGLSQSSPSLGYQRLWRVTLCILCSVANKGTHATFRGRVGHCSPVVGFILMSTSKPSRKNWVTASVLLPEKHLPSHSPHILQSLNQGTKCHVTLSVMDLSVELFHQTMFYVHCSACTWAWFSFGPFVTSVRDITWAKHITMLASNNIFE